MASSPASSPDRSAGSQTIQYIRGRKNSLFELVEPPATTAQVDRPQSLILPDHMSASSPALPVASAPDDERLTKKAILRNLQTALGKDRIPAADLEAIEAMIDGQPEPLVSRAPSKVSSPKVSPSKRKGFFRRKSTKTPLSPIPGSPHTEAPIAPVIGVALGKLPSQASCAISLGNAPYIVPIWAYKLVETMYKRGLDRPGLLRTQGDSIRASALLDLFNHSPDYGDQLDLSNEPIDNVATAFRRCLEALPEPIYDSRLNKVFQQVCVRNTSLSPQTRASAAQVLLSLLPTPKFHLMIYLTAFFAQLPQHPATGLSVAEVASIAGPSLLAPRAGFPATKVAPNAAETAEIGAKWLLENWAVICGTAPADPDPFARVPTTSTTTTTAVAAAVEQQQPNPTSPTQNVYNSPPEVQDVNFREAETGSPAYAFSSPSQELLVTSLQHPYDSSQPLAARGVRHPSPTNVPFPTKRYSAPVQSLATSDSPPGSHTTADSPTLPASTPRKRSSAPVAPIFLPHGGFTLSDVTSSAASHEDSHSSNRLSFHSIEKSSPDSSTHDLPLPVPYVGGHRVQPSLTSIASGLVLSVPGVPGDTTKKEQEKEHHLSRSLGGTPTPTALPEALWLREHSVASPSRLQRSPTLRTKVDETQQKLQEHLEESIKVHKQLKSDNEALLRRIAESEQEMARQREAHLSHLAKYSQDIHELRQALVKKQGEEDSAIREYRQLASRAEQQAMLAKEESLAELQKLMVVVERLSKEKDVAQKRLKAVKHALSIESIQLLSARSSALGFAHLDQPGQRSTSPESLARAAI